MESSDNQQNITTTPENSDTIPTADPTKKLSKTDEETSSPSPPPDHKDTPPNQDHDDKHEQSDPDQEPPPANPTEAPPNQEMERSVSSYRIPSSVFARSTSTTPMDWSVQSNESLFSIHTGNMSFANDHYYWRSGELGPPTAGGEASTSDQMFNYNSGHQSAAEGATAADMRSRELGIAEAVMKEVIKESEGQRHPTMPATNVRNTHRSQESNTSTTSFAFSTMGGETDHHQKGDQSMRTPSTEGSSPEQAQSQPDQSQSHPLMNPAEPQPSIKSEPKTPKATEDEANKCKWFSCLSCCSCCNSKGIL